jgi:hypothetical protein
MNNNSTFKALYKAQKVVFNTQIVTTRWLQKKVSWSPYKPQKAVFDTKIAAKNCHRQNPFFETVSSHKPIISKDNKNLIIG